MGAALFGALGNLGEQWGEARQAQNEQALRTRILAAQMQRQEAMGQLEQQRSVLEKQRLENTIAEQKQKADQYYQKGWLPGTSIVYSDPADKNYRYIANPFAAAGQEAKRRMTAAEAKEQGYVTWPEEQEARRAPRVNTYEERMDAAKKMATDVLGFTPNTPEWKQAVGRFYNAAGEKIQEGLTGGMGGDPEMSAIYADMLAHGQPLTSIPMKDRARAWLSMPEDQRPVKLTPQAQQVITQTAPIRSALEQMLGVLEPLKNDDTAGKFAWERFSYATGRATPWLGVHASPEATVLGDATQFISQTELTRLTAAARVMRSSSRTLQMLNQALVHVPNVWRDSPKKMYGQIQTLIQTLDQTDSDAFNLGKAGGIVPGDVPGLTLPGRTPQAPGTTAPPPPPAGGADPLNIFPGGPR